MNMASKLAQVRLAKNTNMYLNDFNYFYFFISSVFPVVILPIVSCPLTPATLTLDYGNSF